MRSSGIRQLLSLAVAAACCVLLLAACKSSGGSGASSTPSAAPATASASASGAAAAKAACGLLTKAEVAQATGKSIDFSRQTNVGAVSTCTFGSFSGFAVVLSVTNSPAAGLSSDIPGLGNLVTKYHLAAVSGIGDQAYAGSNAIIARKGNIAFAIVYASTSGGNHEQVLKTLATEVVSRL